MQQYLRFTPKLFGENALAAGNDPQIGQFGSALAGTYMGTSDVQEIQALNAWLSGFIGAVTPSEQFPPLPEMTGVLKVFSYLINGLYQQGVPEWDSGTTYYQNNFCNRNGVVYISKINGNTNHDPATDISHTYWDDYAQASSSVIGMPQFTLDFNNLPVNCVWLEGQANNSITTYANLFNIYGYDYGGSGQYFTFPNFQGLTIWGGTTPGYISAGLPSIAHTHSFTLPTAETHEGSGRYILGSGTSTSSKTRSTNGINSTISSIYGASSTVQPPAIKVRVYTRYQ